MLDLAPLTSQAVPPTSLAACPRLPRTSASFSRPCACGTGASIRSRPLLTPAAVRPRSLASPLAPPAPSRSSWRPLRPRSLPVQRASSPSPVVPRPSDTPLYILRLLPSRRCICAAGSRWRLSPSFLGSRLRSCTRAQHGLSRFWPRPRWRARLRFGSRYAPWLSGPLLTLAGTSDALRRLSLTCAGTSKAANVKVSCGADRRARLAALQSLASAREACEGLHGDWMDL